MVTKPVVPLGNLVAGRIVYMNGADVPVVLPLKPVVVPLTM